MNIRPTTFGGHAAVEIKTTRARMILVTETGPRIAHLSALTRKAETRNLLFWDDAKKHRRKEWRLHGGHRIWATRPGADEAEETYAADNALCAVRVNKNRVVVEAPESLGIAKSLAVRVLDEATFEVNNSIVNTGSMLWSGGVWSLTCTVPTRATSYGIPLGDHSAWDTFAIVIPRTWGGGQTSRINDSQISMTEHCMVIKPAGRQSKRMVQAPQGLIGMTDTAEKISFWKHSPYVRGAPYPLNCNVAFYIGPKNFMFEMETMGAEKTLKPGEAARNVETWALRDPVDWKKAKSFAID